MFLSPLLFSGMHALFRHPNTSVEILVCFLSLVLTWNFTISASSLPKLWWGLMLSDENLSPHRRHSSQLKAWNQLEEKEASGVKENHSTRRAVCKQALMLTGEGGGREDQVHRRQFFTFLQQVRAWESPSPRSLGWRWMRGRERQPGSQDSCPMTLRAHALRGDLWGHVNTEPPILTPRPPSHLPYSFLCFTTYVYFLLVIHY